MSEARRERRNYLLGTGLSILLSLLAFGSVIGPFGKTTALWVISVSAVVQILVQLRFFLHIGLGRQKREDLLLILFSLLLLCIMVGGTLWILTNLAQRMT